ncbi:putative ZDHHC-type palmitoyltransferase 6 [Channa argus]|uniref:Palmitoyltransferase n=1 Tax=Channa argus TaxID=215402 RepID=A0A6G1R162_CHAAH|nr:putative ZDHHC-type palmitoyltransferase 6 [Channa argus]
MYPMPVCSVSYGDIFDCIQRGNIEQCIQFIQNDRSVLKQKGWGGFTPLHYAALHGNRALVDFFLSNGADPNVTCDAGQTAFHFACRQGNIYIIQQMMQYGADLRLIDRQKKTSLHHAVSGGNIVAVQYLWETGMFRFSDTAMYQVTPLHLAASTGNTEVVRYLLRDQRCSVNAVDQQGATPLHVAAERGGVEVSMVHFSLVLGLLCKVLTQDPGTLDRADADPRFTCIADLVENNESHHRFCPYCELFQPDYTKHCKLCDVCIKEYDHHCLFLNRCVGRGNHRLFLFFILSMLMAHLLFVATATSYLCDRMSAGSHSLSSWLTLLGKEFWVTAMIIMNALTLMWEVWLLAEQFDAIAKGTTTYFRQCERSAQPKSLGQCLVKVLSFLLEGRRWLGSGQTRVDKTAIDI